MTAKPRRITTFYSGASAVAAFVAQPIPALDELIVVPIHYRLCTKLAKAHGIPKRDLPWKEIRRIIWYGAAARLVANFSLGFVPLVGMFANAVTAIALTEFLGQYVEQTLANPDAPPAHVTMDTMKSLFADALKRHAEKKSPAAGEEGAGVEAKVPAAAGGEA
jgi:uncharacterized protein (DUF697 family)